MNLANLEKLAASLGLERSRVSAGNLVTSCPFAKWTHKRGSDRKPSFGILISDADESSYHCFGCHTAGDLLGLIQDLGELREQDLSHLEGWILDNEGLDMAAKISLSESRDIRLTKVERADRKALQTYPESEYEVYGKSVPRYALERGLDIDTCRAWELGHDKEEKRLTFPVRRMGDAALVGIKGRTYANAKAKYFPTLPFNPSNFLYGEHMIRPASEEEKVCIVEGELDAIKCWMAGYTGLSLMGSFPSKEQRRKLAKINRPLVLIPDGDAVGRKWAQRLGDEFKFYVCVYDVFLEDKEDAGQFTPEELRAIIEKARVRL